MEEDKGKQKINTIRKQLRRCQRGGMNSDCVSTAGSTATVVLIGEENVYIANIGDSKTMVFGENLEVLLETVDHRPLHPAEKQRIQRINGKIINGRISGDLNVSRGIGDHFHKNLEHPEKSVISSTPDVYTLSKSKINYIFMGSDGIWESPNPRDTCMSILRVAGESCNNIFAIQNHLNETIAKSVSDKTGMDNMTSIFINFRKEGRRALAYPSI